MHDDIGHEDVIVQFKSDGKADSDAAGFAAAAVEAAAAAAAAVEAAAAAAAESSAIAAGLA
eukprot:2283543-Amphidinium_carterae.1